MAEFPARDGDELVTKDFLRAELAEVRSDLSAALVRHTLMMIGAVAVATTSLGGGLNPWPSRARPFGLARHRCDRSMAHDSPGRGQTIWTAVRR